MQPFVNKTIFVAMQIVNQVKYLIKKEMLLEWRSKYALNGVLLYVVSTVFVCYLSFISVPNKLTWNALFWIIMLFASINAVAKSFLQESRGRHLYIYTLVSPAALIIAKTIYNSLLMIVLTLIALFFYSLVFPFNSETDLLMYLVATILGSLSFATIFTMVSAIAAKAGNGGMLMAILSFPIVIPVLIVLVKLSKNAIDGLDRSVSLDDIGLLIVINVLITTVSLLLFPYLWRD
jgi:heme exporter protein B